MKKLANYNVYDTIHELPVQNYFHYYKLSMMVNSVYFNHDKMIDIWNDVGNKEAKQIQERNKINMQHMNKNGVNLVLMGFLCLCEGVTNFTDRNLLNISKTIDKEYHEVIYKEYNELSKYFKGEMIDAKVLQGAYLEDNETALSREEFFTYEQLQRDLLRGMRNGFDMKIYSEAIANAFSIVDASEVSFNTISDMNKTLAILRRENYHIVTAFDYLIAVQLLKESVSNRKP